MSEPAALLCVGAVAPAALTYARLAAALTGDARLFFTDPACFVEPLTPNYGLAYEVDEIFRAADQAGLAAFHLLGYSIGASLALVAALAQPRRIRSLVLVEPPWIGNDAGDAAAATFLESIDRVVREPAAGRYRSLLQAVSSSGTDLAAILPGEPPEWLVKRPKQFGHLWSCFRACGVDTAEARGVTAPVYLPVGGRSHPWFAQAARQLQTLFANAVVDVYDECSHLDAPHLREAGRFATGLRALWRTDPVG